MLINTDALLEADNLAKKLRKVKVELLLQKRTQLKTIHQEEVIDESLYSYINRFKLVTRYRKNISKRITDF